MKFKNYLKTDKFLNDSGSIAFFEGFWEKIKLPNIFLDLPEIEKKSKIVILKDKINPIFIQLDDGSKLFFTIDEFNRIIGQPKIGRILKYKMQRLPQDKSKSFSKITSCVVI